MLTLLSVVSRKALKVVDLKDILSKAQVSVTGKANKPDLIAKILASQQAIDVYNQLHGGGSAQPSQDASPAPTSSLPKPPPVRLSTSPSVLLFIVSVASRPCCSHPKRASAL